MDIHTHIQTYIQPPSYRFDGFLFRPAVAEDLPLAQRWNAEDPDHAWEGMNPVYWIEQNEQVNSYLLEDDKGVVFFVKSIRQSAGEVEISLQFDRSRMTVSRHRAMRGMLAGMEWLKKALPLNGFRAVYFLSKNPELTGFAMNALGFVRDGPRYIYFFVEDRHGEADSRKTEEDPRQGVRALGTPGTDQR
jgi:hypothetical protein